MKRVNLVLLFHMHQPVGNFPEIIKMATEKAYLPLLYAMKDSPEIPFGLHISGPLWEYFEENNPEIYDLIIELSERGQVELVGGGFYEPILPVIPQRDAEIQLERMSDFIEDHFSQVPRGIWLAERIWEPALPSLLNEAGIRYVAVDDYHFRTIGIDHDDLMGYYLTENEGKTISLFPVSERLRYLMPFAEVHETIDYLRSCASDVEENLLVFGDDAEKFGMWQDTHKWVWQEGWFNRFITALKENSDWLRVLKPLDAMEQLAPSGRVYLPTGSYFEMNEWTLPTPSSKVFAELYKKLDNEGLIKTYKPYISGGYWRNYLTKYEESNWMHKRMLFASRRLTEELPQITDDQLEFSETALYKSQCNCAYWHGVFGGLYLPHLRHAVWENILACESQLGRPDDLPYIEDIDCDGFDEILMMNDNISVWIKPESGGMINEVTLPKFGINLTNTLSRYYENYHTELPESFEDNQVLHMNYDKYCRKFAHDHILSHDSRIETFSTSEYAELADFVTKPYEVISAEETEIIMRRATTVHCCDCDEITITKRIILDKENSRLLVNYKIENGDKPVDFLFGVEANYGIPAGNDPERYFFFPSESQIKHRPDNMRSINDPGDYEYRDSKWNLRISNRSRADKLWMLPLYTTTKMENRFEKTYQGTTAVHLYKCKLEPGEIAEYNVSWWFSPLDDENFEPTYPGLFD